MSIVEVTISKSDQKYFEKIKKQILSFKDEINSATIEKLSIFFHGQIVSHLKNFSTEIKQLKQKQYIDAIYVTGLPKFHNTESELICAKVISFSLGLIIGEPFQYKQQNCGEVIAEIKPIKGKEQTSSNAGIIKFGWHTDDCFLPPMYRTKWIQLYGFHNPDNVLTKIALVDDIISLIPETFINKLMLKNYKVKIPTSFGLGDKWSSGIPLLKINGNNQFEIGVPTYHVLPTNPNDETAISAINHLIEAANQSQKSYCLQPGNALILNNDRLLHARDEILTSRLILRTYIRPDLYELNKATCNYGNRIFDLEKLIEA